LNPDQSLKTIQAEWLSNNVRELLDRLGAIASVLEQTNSHLAEISHQLHERNLNGK
jgi:hypothetical protein